MKVSLRQAKSSLEALMTNKLGSSTVLEIVPSSRDNYVLLDKSSKLIVRVSLNKSLSDVTAEVALLKYLKNHDLPTPEVIDFGSVEVQGKNYPFVIFKYLDHLQSVNIGKEQIGLAATLLGNLHSLTAKYCQVIQYKQRRTLAQDLLKLQQNLAVNDNKAINKKQILDDLGWAIDFYNSRRKEDSKLILHNDYRTNNVLFSSPQSIACVIDFDWSVESPYGLKDLSHAALEWSYPDGSRFNLELYDHFINHYWKSDTPVNEVTITEVWMWSKFSALADAVHYFLSFPERTEEKFESYMYDKYLYFKDNEV